MSIVIGNIWQGYGYLIKDLADHRTEDWFLVQNPLYLIAILLSYNYFCTTLGPSLMKDRKPFKLNSLIKLYNSFQVMFSVYMLKEISPHMFSSDFNFFCHRVNESNDSHTLRVVSVCWMYYIAKLTELVDTVFFVLKKSNRQVSFLHLYHHTIMACAAWVAVKYYPGGHSIVIGWINTFVHIVMYTYYLIASFGSEYKKYLWWKKYLTVMQIIQFAIISIQQMVSLFYDCGFPTTIKILLICGTSTFTWMFSNFYYHTYIKGKNKKQ